MSGLTPEQWEEWREEAADWLGEHRLTDTRYDQARILALLDALDAAEQTRDEYRAILSETQGLLLDRAERAELERGQFAQAMWDAEREMGVDTDGDLTPAARITNPHAVDLFCRGHVQAAVELRADVEQAYEDEGRARAALARVTARLDAWDEKRWYAVEAMQLRNSFVADLRAALTTEADQ